MSLRDANAGADEFAVANYYVTLGYLPRLCCPS
jgi:hypothetical protein